jgi:hypothetical protein
MHKGFTSVANRCLQLNEAFGGAARVRRGEGGNCWIDPNAHPRASNSQNLRENCVMPAIDGGEV